MGVLSDRSREDRDMDEIEEKIGHGGFWNRSKRLSRRISRKFRMGQTERSRKAPAPRISQRSISFAGFDANEGAVITKADPMLLLYHLPVKLSAPSVTITQGRLSSKMKIGPLAAEIRGVLVVLKEISSDGWDINSDAQNIQYLMCPIGCKLRCTDKRISFQKDGSKVELTFGSPAEARIWEKHLTRLTNLQAVTLADFKVIAPIGRGAEGEVYLVKHRKTGRYLALKAISKAMRAFYSEMSFRRTVDERFVLESLVGVDGFIQLVSAFQTTTHFFVVTEFYEGGDLYNYMFMRQEGVSVEESRSITAEIVLALEYMHSKGILYRDLKPENVLLDSRGHCVLADFGLCKYFPQGLLKGRTDSVCGTASYVAPEMVSGDAYGRSVDVFALGAFLFHIISGHPPYKVDNSKSLERNVSDRHELKLRRTFASADTADLIGTLLQRNPDARIDACTLSLEQLRQHKFFKGVDWKQIGVRESTGALVDSCSDDFFDEEARLLRNFTVNEWTNNAHLEANPVDCVDDVQLWPLCSRQDLPRLSGLLPGFYYPGDLDQAVN